MLVESSEQRTKVHNNFGGENHHHGRAGPDHHEHAYSDHPDFVGSVRRELVNS
jgi:hypothetical protein